MALATFAGGNCAGAAWARPLCRPARGSLGPHALSAARMPASAKEPTFRCQFRVLNGSSIFRLTRVTRIFERSVFTETTPEARAACRAGFFVARARLRPRAAGFACLQKNREIQRRSQAKAGTRPHGSGHPDYFVAGGRSLRSIRDRSALRNESSVSIVFANPAWRSLMVLTKARGPCAAP